MCSIWRSFKKRITGEDSKKEESPEELIDILTSITDKLIERGQSLYDIDCAEFESLWEYLVYKRTDRSTGYIDEVM